MRLKNETAKNDRRILLAMLAPSEEVQISMSDMESITNTGLLSVEVGASVLPVHREYHCLVLHLGDRSRHGVQLETCLLYCRPIEIAQKNLRPPLQVRSWNPRNWH